MLGRPMIDWRSTPSTEPWRYALHWRVHSATLDFGDADCVMKGQKSDPLCDLSRVRHREDRARNQPVPRYGAR